MNAIIERMSSKGQRIEIEVVDRFAVAYVDGKRVASQVPGKLAKPVAANGAVYTHSLGPIALTTAEYETIEAARKKARKNAKTCDLRAEREALAAKVWGLREDADAAFDRLHDQQDTDAAYRARGAYDARIAAAQDALLAFDREHPEVYERIAAERINQAERNTWQ